MAHLTLYNYDDNFDPVDVDYAEMEFYNFVNGTADIDNQGNRWLISVTDTSDIKVCNLSTEEDIKYTYFTQELFQSLNIYGLHNYAIADIRGAGYVGDTYGHDDQQASLPWMQLVSQDLQGTHIIYKAPGGYVADPIIGFFDNGLPMIAAPLAVHRPNDEVWYGHIALGYGGAGANYTHIQIVMCRYLTKETWGELTLDPGAKGYRPTGTRNGSKQGVGGIGHGAIGKKPGYETATLTNPGAPDESTASVIGSGLITPYKMSKLQLGKLSDCLYGSTLGGLITNLAINPLDFIVSLNVFPCSPDVGSSTNIKLGKWVCTDSGVDSLGGDVTGLPLTSQFKVVSFGSVSVPENWGSFLDYTNTTIELYLPFIGFVDLDTSEVMNGSVAVDYTIDFLTGMCVANVNCNKTVETPDGYSYSQSSQHAYQGNCAMTVPLSAIQYGNMIGSMIQAGVTGMTGDPKAITGLIGDFLGGGMRIGGSSKGSISANAGFCSILAPYLRVCRPVSGEPESFQEVMGYPSYIDSYLGSCSDLCVCDSIDLRSISGATDSEIERIRQMCLEGVHV